MKNRKSNIYNIHVIINGNDRVVNGFKTRDKANKYLDRILEKSNLTVNDVFFHHGNKHEIEYVCDHYNRFIVERA